MHSKAQNRTLLSRAKTARHGQATWLTAGTHSLMFVYVGHRAVRSPSSAQRCDRLATDSRTPARSSTRPPPRQTSAQETHVHSADIVPADNVNRGTYRALSMASGGGEWGRGEFNGSPLLIEFRDIASTESFISSFVSQTLED